MHCCNKCNCYRSFSIVRQRNAINIVLDKDVNAVILAIVGLEREGGLFTPVVFGDEGEVL